MCLRHYISWFENHQPQKTKVSAVIYAPFIQNSNQMASWLTVTTSYPRVFFNSTQRPSFSAYRAAPMTKTDLLFPAFSSRFVDFSVQFCFCCKFHSMNERCSGLMVSALDPAASGPGSSPGRGHCVVSFGQDTLLSQCLSPPKCINGYRQIVGETWQVAGKWPAMD